MANIKFSQFTTTSPSDTVSLVGYLSTDNVKFTIADLKTQFNSSYVTLGTAQSITATKQFTTFPILGDQAYTASYGSEVKLYSSHNADSRWIFNSVGVHNKIFSFRVNDLQRWAFRVNQDAESGSNAGTNFELRRYNDAGTFIDSPISITRSNGTVAFGGNIELLGSMNLGDSVTLSNAELQTLEGIETGGGVTIQDQLNSRSRVVSEMSIGLASIGAGITAETNLDTIVIPANTFAIGDRFEVHVAFFNPSNTGTKTYRLRLNGTGIGGTLISGTASVSASVTNMLGIVESRIVTGNNLYSAISSTSLWSSALVTFDPTVSNTIFINGVKSAGGDTFILFDWKLIKV